MTTRTSIPLAVVISISVALLSACSTPVPQPPVNTGEPGPGPSVSLSPDPLDERAAALCDQLDTQSGLLSGLELRGALDSVVGDARQTAPEEFQPDLNADLEGVGDDTYIAVCYFLGVVPNEDVVIVGALDSGDIVLLNSF